MAYLHEVSVHYKQAGCGDLVAEVRGWKYSRHKLEQKQLKRKKKIRMNVHFADRIRLFLNRFTTLNP